MPFNISHYFIPCESNNFRAKTIHTSAILFYITVLVLIQVSFNVLSFVKPGVLGYATDISIERLLELTNQKRIENGLGSLTIDSQLSQAAALKANDMFSNNYWAHSSPLGKSPWDFILGSGYHYVYAGENLAKDFANSDGVVSAWMASPTHRDNIINQKYKDVGFAVVNGKLNGLETTLIVQMFGSRTPVTANIPQIANIEVPTVIPAESSLEKKAEVSPIIKTQKKAIKPETSSQVITPTPVLLSNLKNYSRTNPTINIFSLTKEFSLTLVIILVSVLTIDGYVAFRKKHARISGDNIAHITFLVILILAILITSVGMISDRGLISQ